MPNIVENSAFMFENGGVYSVAAGAAMDAVIGSSLPRDNMTFQGLGLDEELKQRDAEPRCGLFVVDLRTGEAPHWVRMEGIVTELYDVTALPGVRRPMAVGFVNDEIRRMISIGPEQPL